MNTCKLLCIELLYSKQLIERKRFLNIFVPDLKTQLLTLKEGCHQNQETRHLLHPSSLWSGYHGDDQMRVDTILQHLLLWAIKTMKK